MKIFNSLGSNYSVADAFYGLFAPSFNSRRKLRKMLARDYLGKVVLTIKGREALFLGLEALNLSRGSKVVVTGFTCFVVCQAVKKADLVPIYLDIDETLNFTAEALIQALKKHDIKAVIVQNTLGYPGEVEKIASVCRQNGIYLIEDLAHSVGAMYKNKKAGDLGDIVVLSFSQDKIIDGVVGGALIARNKRIVLERALPILKDPPILITARFYPLFTFLIRSFYHLHLGLGKLLHLAMNSVGLLDKPVDSKRIVPRKINNWACKMVFLAFDKHRENVRRRKKIAHIYSDNLDARYKVVSAEKIEKSVNLRYPITVRKRKRFLSYLKKHGAYLEDIWYEAPVSPKKYMHMTNYKHGTCPVAEKYSKTIVNLPTHTNISPQQAEELCGLINKWQN